MTAPPWLTEEAWLRDLLHWFLSRLEVARTRAVTRRVGAKTLPALYDFAANTRYRWQLIENLASEYGIFDIRYDSRLASFQERYENAQLRLNPESENLLRLWLERPREDPVLKAWRDALAVHCDNFNDRGAALLLLQPEMPGYTPHELVAAFASVGTLLDQTLSLREISARCFWGNSKFLDLRFDLLRSLFGERAVTILPRPLLLTAWAPADFTRVLIVENQDNFLRLADNPPVGYALLYSGGFRASAGRLSGHARFAFLPGSDGHRFQNLWLQAQLPVFFWGDLDFTGLGILKALRAAFPQLEAWQPGYAIMLEHLRSGGGHRPDAAAKAGQMDPGVTGCIYSDQVLLPELRRIGRFIDQEMVRTQL